MLINLKANNNISKPFRYSCISGGKYVLVKKSRRYSWNWLIISQIPWGEDMLNIDTMIIRNMLKPAPLIVMYLYMRIMSSDMYLLAAGVHTVLFDFWTKPTSHISHTELLSGIHFVQLVISQGIIFIVRVCVNWVEFIVKFVYILISCVSIESTEGVDNLSFTSDWLKVIQSSEFVSIEKIKISEVSIVHEKLGSYS